MASEDVKRSRPTPWLGVLMGVVLAVLLSPAQEWMLAALEGPPPEQVAPSSIQTIAQGLDATAGLGLIAVLEERQKLTIVDRLNRKTQLILDQAIQWFGFTADGARLAIRTDDSIQLWDVRDWKTLWTHPFTGSCETTACAPNGTIVTAESQNGEGLFSQLTIHRFVQGEREDVVTILPEAKKWKLDLSAGGRLLVAQTTDRALLVDPASGEVLDDIEFPGEPGQVNVSGDLRYVAKSMRRTPVWRDNHSILIYDRSDGSISRIRENYRALSAVEFMPDNRRLLIRRGSILSVWNVESASVEADLLNSNDVQAAISSGGEIVGISTQSAVAYTWAPGRPSL